MIPSKRKRNKFDAARKSETNVLCLKKRNVFARFSDKIMLSAISRSHNKQFQNANPLEELMENEIIMFK